MAFFSPFWKVAGLAQSFLLTLIGTFTVAELTTKDCFPSTFRVLFPNLWPWGLFLLGSYIGNHELSVVVILSSMSCAWGANSLKDFGLMPYKI
jgi:hypothetical protein